MHEALIMPSRGVAIFIHPYEIVLSQLISLAMTKLPRPIFLLKATDIAKLCSGERSNAGECTKYVTSAFPSQK